MNKTLLPVLAVLLLAHSLGCRRTTPVEEVSLEQSGVTIQDVTRELDPLDWPAWRGADHSGVATDRPLPTTWSETQNIKWLVEVPGRGHSSPIIVGDLVFLATADEQSQQQQVLAYDRETGEKKWTCVVHDGNFPSASVVHRKATHANSTLACDGSRLYIAFLNGKEIIATAINLQGSIVWQKPLGAFRSRFGYAASPVLYKSLVIFAADNEGEGYLAGVDAASGEIAWLVARPAEASFSSPTLVQLDGVDHLVISGCRTVSSYDPSNGNQNWSCDGTAKATCGTVVAGTTEDGIECVFASGGYPESETVCVSATGELIWSDRAKIYEPSMLFSSGNLFAVSDDGIARCWDASTGETRWKKRLKGDFSASPTLCNGHLYVPGLSGQTHVFEASGDEYIEVATNRLGDDCYTSPAVAGSQVFLRVGVGKGGDRKEKLACIEESAG